MSEEPAEDVKPKLNLTVNYEGQSELRLPSIHMFLGLTLYPPHQLSLSRLEPIQILRRYSKLLRCVVPSRPSE